MELEITPEPDEQERRAILAALAAEETPTGAESPWAQALRPGRDDAAP